MKELIQNLIGQNKLIKAIQVLKIVSTDEEKTLLTIIESRYNDLKENSKIGVLSEATVNIESNKIRKDLLELCNKVSARAVNIETFQPQLAQLGINADQLILTEKLKSNNNFKIIAIASAAAVILSLAFIFSYFGEEECLDRKVAVLIANFQNVDEESETDGFSNSLVTRIDNRLSNDTYDVIPVGRQSRQIRRYNEFVKKEYFESNCDTSGLFVNGFLDKSDEIFNIYITLANLKMNIPDLKQMDAIQLDNPSGVEFSLKNNANVLADFILAMIRCYEGRPYEALEKLLELEKLDSQELSRNDQNFKANIAHFKGNCYAMRGDHVRAKKQYKIAKKHGNAELKEAAENNSETADEIYVEMSNDPELKSKISKNKREHSKFEEDLNKFLRALGKSDVVDFFRRIR